MDRKQHTNHSATAAPAHGKSVVRLSRARRLPIIDLSIAKRVGTIEEIQVDTASGRVAALDVRLQNGSSNERIPMARARRIGHHAVVIEGGAEFVPTPLENDRWLESGALLGLEVLADGGDRVGYLSDVYVNRDTLAVEAYELRTPWWERWLGRPRLIMPDQVLASSHELMIIPDQRRAGQESETNWDEVTLTVPMGRRATADGAAEMEAKSA